MSDKIINTFQQRRQLEQAFAELGQTSNESEVREAARQLAHTFPGDLLLDALVKRLDSPNGQLRGGLGHLAGLLNPDEVLPALRNVAANRTLNPQARLTAASIAHRFLGVELPHVLLADLSDTEEIAFQSLREALDEAHRNRHVLLEYVTQMAEHPEEIAWMVMGLLGRVKAEERVDLLRLIAQDQRPRVAKEALAQLENLALTTGQPLALRALQTLQFARLGEVATLAERAVRKARFAGHPYTPPASDGWRALISPADPSGSQSVWLLHPGVSAASGKSMSGVLVGFAHSVHTGITQLFGTETLDYTLLPPIKPIGTLVTVTMDNGRTATMLEAPFDYGRWLLQEAIKQRLAQGGTLPEEYKLYNDLIWQFAPPVVDETLQRLWRQDGESVPTAVESGILVADTAALFAHGAMEGWQLRNWGLLPSAYQSVLSQQELVGALLKQMATTGDSREVAQALVAGLQAQAVWFAIAGEAGLAQKAARLAQQLPHLPLTDNPILAHMLAAAIAHVRPPK